MECSLHRGTNNLKTSLQLTYAELFVLVTDHWSWMCWFCQIIFYLRYIFEDQIPFVNVRQLVWKVRVREHYRRCHCKLLNSDCVFVDDLFLCSSAPTHFLMSSVLIAANAPAWYLLPSHSDQLLLLYRTNCYPCTYYMI